MTPGTTGSGATGSGTTGSRKLGAGRLGAGKLGAGRLGTGKLGTDKLGAGKRSPAAFDPNPAKAGWLTKLVLALLCFVWIIPTLGTIITSFRPQADATQSGWWQIWEAPYRGNISLENYRDAVVGAEMSRSLVNSFAIALPSTFIPILIAAFAAYAFTFMQFRGRNFLFLGIVSLLVVPNYVAFVPVLKVYAMDTVRMNGGFPAVWLAHIGFGMSLAIYILRNYMATLPASVIESAKIDGASHFQTFWRLVLPMSVPALASFAIFQFLWVWNDLLVALVFVGPGENEPVTLALTGLRGQLGQGWNLTTAGGLVSLIVPVTVFLLLQRYFVRGLTAGAVKG